MKMPLFVLAIFLLVSNIKAQPNCNVFLWNKDTAQYNACKLLTENQHKYYQFSKEFHNLVDSAILICPHFAYAYREKAAPYVKSGNFIEWKKNIDLAVKYDSLGYLAIRASLRYKFFADYEGTIKDIELLERISPSDIGHTSNGTYHLKIAKALCHKQLGRVNEGINIIENLLSNKKYSVGLYDYFHLGVMYFQIGQYEKAIVNLNKQLKQYDLAEVQYYLAKSYKKIGNTEAYLQAKQSSEKMYKENKRMFDQYNFMIDQIFEQDIHNI